MIRGLLFGVGSRQRLEGRVGISVRYMSRRVAQEMLQRSKDPSRTGPLTYIFDDAVEGRTKTLGKKAQWEIELASMTFAHLMTRRTERGAGLGDHASTVAIAETFATHGEAERVKYVLQKLATFRIQAPAAIYVQYIQAFLNRNEPAQALLAVVFLQSREFEPETPTCADLIRAFAKAKARQELIQLKSILHYDRDHPDILAAELSAAAEQPEQLAEVLIKFRQLNTYYEDTFLDLLEQMDFEDGYEELQAALAKPNWTLKTIRPFAVLARQEPERAEELAALGLQHGLRFDEDMYTILLNAARMRLDLRRAEELLTELRIAMKITKPECYNALIDLHIRAGDWTAAQALLQEMRHTFIEANEETFHLQRKVKKRAESYHTSSQPLPEPTSTVKAHHSVVSKALRTLHSECAETSESLTALNHLAQLGEVEHLNALQNRIEEKVGSFEYGLALMKAQCGRGDYSTALATFERSRVDVKPIEQEVRQLVEAIDLFQGKPLEVVLEVAKDDGYVQAAAVSRAMLRCWVRQKDVEGARAEVQRLESLGVATEDDFVQLMDAMKPVERTKVIDEMAGKGIEPTFLSYNSVMESLVEFGMPEKVSRLVDRMKALQIKPSLRTFELMIDVAARNADASAAMQAYRTMHANGFATNHAILLSLVRAFINADEIRAAETIVRNVLEDEPALEPDLKQMIIEKHLSDGDYQNALTWYTQYPWPNKEQIQQRLLLSKP